MTTEQATQAILQTPEGQAAFKNGPVPGIPGRILTLALKKGLITPGDLDPKHFRVDPDGTVHMDEAIPTAAKLAIIGIGGAVAGSLIAGAVGSGGGAAAATTAGQTPAEFAAGSTTVGGASAAGGSALTGGKILGALGDVGPVLGSAAAGAAKSNALTDQTNLGRDELAQKAYQDSVTNPGTRLRSAYKASMIAHQTPTTFTGGPGGAGPVHFSGGFSNPEVAAAVKPQADDVVAQQLQEQLLRGSDAPKPTPPAGGAGDDILGGLALGTNILGAFGARKKTQQNILGAMNGGGA